MQFSRWLLGDFNEHFKSDQLSEKYNHISSENTTMILTFTKVQKVTPHRVTPLFLQENCRFTGFQTIMN